MKMYAVYLQQDNDYCLITKEERDEHLQLLKKYDKDLTVDYSDGDAPFYNSERLIDEFSVSDAIDDLKKAKVIEVNDDVTKQKNTLENFAYTRYRSHQDRINIWFMDFFRAANIEAGRPLYYGENKVDWWKEIPE